MKKPLPGTRFGGRVIGTEEAWALTELPATLAVVGAGASGTEIASAYARLGSDVTLYEGLDRVLPTEDADISKLAERGFKKQGIKVRTGVFVENVESGDDGVHVHRRGRAGGGRVARHRRRPRARHRGRSASRRPASRWRETGLIAVDGAMRTSLAGVYAIGDLVHGPALAHKASDEGIIAAEDAAGLETHPIEYIDIPRATFCSAQRRQLRAHRAAGARRRPRRRRRQAAASAPSARARSTATAAGLVKIVGDRTYGELLGGHIVGTQATELIQELVNVRALEGGFGEVARIVHGHPTLSEAVMEAARDADGWIIHG